MRLGEILRGMSPLPPSVVQVESTGRATVVAGFTVGGRCLRAGGHGVDGPPPLSHDVPCRRVIS